jgi:hypothetical protein
MENAKAHTAKAISIASSDFGFKLNHPVQASVYRTSFLVVG